MRRPGKTHGVRSNGTVRVTRIDKTYMHTDAPARLLAKCSLDAHAPLPGSGKYCERCHAHLCAAAGTLSKKSRKKSKENRAILDVS